MRYDADMYNKLFTKILDSSIWLEDDSTRLIWLTFLAVMDQDGFAQFASVANLAYRARVPLVATRKAVAKLEGPDDCSSDPENEGRRVERIPGGWMILNAAKYRELVTREIAREKTRDRVARFRARNASVTAANDSVTPSETATHPDPDVQTKSPYRRAPRSDESFDAWWGVYPKKVGRGAAFKVWQRLKPDTATVAKMHDALRWQRTQPQWTKEGGVYVPNPATYLNQRRWEDEPFFAATAPKSQVVLPARLRGAIEEAQEQQHRTQEAHRLMSEGMSREAAMTQAFRKES